MAPCMYLLQYIKDQINHSGKLNLRKKELVLGPEKLPLECCKGPGGLDGSTVRKQKLFHFGTMSIKTQPSEICTPVPDLVPHR